MKPKKIDHLPGTVVKDIHFTKYNEYVVVIEDPVTPGMNMYCKIKWHQIVKALKQVDWIASLKQTQTWLTVDDDSVVRK